MFAILGWEGEPRVLARRRSRAARMLRAAGGLALGEGPGRAWERTRYAAPYLRDDLMDAGALVDTLETATTWSGLADLHAGVGDAVREALAARGTPALVGCHVSHLYGSGASLYFTIIARAQEGAELEQWRAAKQAAGDAIAARGATITHHHAVGADHRPWLEAEIGGVGVEILRAAKERLDPVGIMNPGKLIPGGRYASPRAPRGAGAAYRAAGRPAAVSPRSTESPEWAGVAVRALARDVHVAVALPVPRQRAEALEGAAADALGADRARVLARVEEPDLEQLVAADALDVARLDHQRALGALLGDQRAATALLAGRGAQWDLAQHLGLAWRRLAATGRAAGRRGARGRRRRLRGLAPGGERVEDARDEQPEDDHPGDDGDAALAHRGHPAPCDRGVGAPAVRGGRACLPRGRSTPRGCGSLRRRPPSASPGSRAPAARRWPRSPRRWPRWRASGAAVRGPAERRRG